MRNTTMVKSTALVSLLALVLVLSVGCTAAIPELGTQVPGGQAGGAQSEDSSGSDVNQTPEAHDLIEASETPEAQTPEATGTLEPGEDIELKGSIDSLSGNTVVIDGQTYVVPPELQSLLAKLGPGDVVEIKAKLDANGQLVLVEIKVEDRGDDNANINDNTDDHGNDDANLNTNTNDNADDQGGGSGDDSGGGNSGGGDDSGGGGDDSGGHGGGS